MQSIESLENKHAGEDIYIIGAGKSSDYYDESFFDNRVSIGVNNVWVKYKNINYNIYRDTPIPENDIDATVIVSKYRGSTFSWGNNSEHVNDGCLYFNHNDNKPVMIEDGLHPNGDKLAVSFSTIVSAIHLAAYMGAGAVFLVGHDCATIDGHSRMANYPKFNPAYGVFIGKLEAQTIIMRKYLRDNYNIPLISLSPFIGLKHEGLQIT